MKQNSSAEQQKQRKSLAAAEREENQRFDTFLLITESLKILFVHLKYGSVALSVTTH